MNPIVQRLINKLYDIYGKSVEFIKYIESIESIKSIESIESIESVKSIESVESIRESVICLLNDKYQISDNDIKQQILDNPYILCKEQLFEYIDCENEYSTLYCTFKDLFIKVYGRIINNEHVDVLWKRLNEEMIESDCKCYTGRLNRLINVLNGFYEDIKINISDNEQISIKNKLSNEDELSDEDEIMKQYTKECTKECTKELNRRGYNFYVVD